MADPATGVAVYDSTPYQGQSGRLVFGGTSVAAPVIAGVYGLAANAASVTNTYPYAHTGSLFDVTPGQQRHLHHRQVVQGRHRLGRPDRPRHPERHRSLLIRIARRARHAPVAGPSAARGGRR